MSIIVEAIKLNKTFKYGSIDIEVLKNIDININLGEFISIMGPSGSGKSTLLYLLGGLERPSSGVVKIKGNDFTSLNDKKQSEIRRKDIGFVFQFYNLIPNLNVEDNILLPVILDGKSSKSHYPALNNILEYIKLSHRRYHTPNELSGGEQQRVSIARAIINEPDIILADEPTGNLDSKTGFEILELLKNINREKNKTIVMVTHSNEAAKYSDKIITLKDGEITKL